jgi:hypothetical protein
MFPDRLGIAFQCTSHCFDFGLLFLVFGYFKKMVVVRASFTDLNFFFVKAHYESGYEEGKQNQTVYYTSTMPILIRRVGQLMMLIWILGPKNI